MSKSGAVLKNKKGVASIEAVAMMIVFVILMAYGIGMFGVIHTGILNSIAARTYAWETFNHRANVAIFRDNRSMPDQEHYLGVGFRIHSVSSEYSTDDFWRPSERMIAMGRETEIEGRNTGQHRQLRKLSKRERIGVNPIWIKTNYGICLNSTCGAVTL